MNAPALFGESRVGAGNRAKVKPAPRYWTAEEVRRLTHMREVEGLTPRQIAPRLDRSPSSIEAKIAVLCLRLPGGWRVAGGSTLPAKQMDAVRRHWMRGDTVEYAAERCNLFEPRVARAYRQFAEEERSRAALPPQIGTYIGAKEMMVIAAPICGVMPAAITGPSRMKAYVCARIAIAQALKDRGVSAGRIAKSLGRGDHTTALHWFKQFKPYSHAYPETLRAYEAIKRAEALAAERLAA